MPKTHLFAFSPLQIPVSDELSGEYSIPSAGSYVVVEILEATSNTLIGRPLFHSSVAGFRKWKDETETGLSFAAAAAAAV